MKHVFSNRNALKTGWGLFRANWKFILVLGFITTLAQIFISAVEQGLDNHSAFLSGILGVIAILISIIIRLGWSKVALALVRKHDVDYKTFRTHPSLWLQSIKAVLWLILYGVRNTLLVLIPGAIIAGIGFSIKAEWLSIVGIVLGGGAAALVVIYMSIKYQFISYVVVEHSHENSKKVFTKSGALTDGVWWKLFGFSIVTGIITLGGALCFLVGLIAILPTIMLARTQVYEILKKRHETGSVSGNE